MISISATRQKTTFQSLLDELEPTIRSGFLAAIGDIDGGINERALLDALRIGDTEGAISALNIDADAWAKYSAAITSAYYSAGSKIVSTAVSSKIAPVGTRFSIGSNRAQEWVSTSVVESVNGYTRDQIDAARRFILSGKSREDSAETIMRGLIGRRDSPRQARVGGIIGLDAPRADRLDKVISGMRTPDGVKSLVVKRADGSLAIRYKVNKATADRIIAAYKADRAVPQSQIDISERQYKNALIKDRADTIVITEGGMAVSSATDEGWRQSLEATGIDGARIVKTWRHVRGASEFHRPEHLAMNGVSVIGVNTPFVFSDGVSKMYAHDSGGGARHNIRCGCLTTYAALEQ